MMGLMIVLVGALGFGLGRNGSRGGSVGEGRIEGMKEILGEGRGGRKFGR